MSNTWYSWILKFSKAHYYFLIKMPNCSYYLNSWTLKMVLVVNFWLLREEVNLGLKVQVFNRFLKYSFSCFYDKSSKKIWNVSWIAPFSPKAPTSHHVSWTTFSRPTFSSMKTHLLVSRFSTIQYIYFVFWIYTSFDIFVWQCDFSNVKYVLWLQNTGIHCYMWCVYKV